MITRSWTPASFDPRDGQAIFEKDLGKLVGYQPDSRVLTEIIVNANKRVVFWKSEIIVLLYGA